MTPLVEVIDMHKYKPHDRGPTIHFAVLPGPEAVSLEETFPVILEVTNIFRIINFTLHSGPPPEQTIL